MTPGALELLKQLDQPRLRELDLGDRRVGITHPDRVFWPATSDDPAISGILMCFAVASMSIAFLRS